MDVHTHHDIYVIHMSEHVPEMVEVPQILSFVSQEAEMWIHKNKYSSPKGHVGEAILIERGPMCFRHIYRSKQIGIDELTESLNSSTSLLANSAN